MIWRWREGDGGRQGINWRWQRMDVCGRTLIIGVRLGRYFLYWRWRERLAPHFICDLAQCDWPWPGQYRIIWKL